MFSFFLLFILISSVSLRPVLDVSDERLLPNDDALFQAEDVNYHSDPSIVLSDPIDSATKLLIDLDAHVQQFIASENAINEQTVSPALSEPITSEPQIYSGAIDSDVGLVFTRQTESVSNLVEQLDTLQNRIQETVTQLTNNRRYILSAMLRPMLNSVRRIRANIVRIQTQLTNIQSVATSASAAGQNNRPGGSGPASPSPAEQGALDSIRRRVDDIQKRIGDIMQRISTSLALPGSGAAQSGQSGPSVPALPGR